VPIDARRAGAGLLVAGVAGAFLFLPAMSFIGTVVSPSELTAASRHVAPLVGDAIWARALGGTATELQPVNPFTLARMLSCHVMAERLGERRQRDREHDECMKLIPGIQGAVYLSTAMMRSDGVWQTPRVPFIQIANVTRVTNTWTRQQLIDTIAERSEFRFASRGVENAARSYFAREVNELTVPQAALLASLLGDQRADPWCDPEGAAAMRQRVLDRMRENGAIDAATYDSASRAELGLAEPPPANHQPCGA
jgi:hypothetical protein